MKKIIFVIIVINSLVIFINEISAQERFHISLNAGYTFPIGGGEYYSNLKGGKNLGFNFSYSLISVIEITGYVGYSYIPSKNIFSEPISPYKESTVFSPVNVNPDFYQTSFGIRIINAMAKIKPFLAVETGLYFMTKVMGRYFTDVDVTAQSVYEKFYGIGFGLILPLNTQLDLTIEGRYESTFTGNQTFFPSMFGVRYNF